jgi:hypothetical protein
MATVRPRSGPPRAVLEVEQMGALGAVLGQRWRSSTGQLWAGGGAARGGHGGGARWRGAWLRISLPTGPSLPPLTIIPTSYHLCLAWFSLSNLPHILIFVCAGFSLSMPTRCLSKLL